MQIKKNPTTIPPDSLKLAGEFNGWLQEETW
jgi:hypothetical protein